MGIKCSNNVLGTCTKCQVLSRHQCTCSLVLAATAKRAGVEGPNSGIGTTIVKVPYFCTVCRPNGKGEV